MRILLDMVFKHRLNVLTWHNNNTFSIDKKLDYVLINRDQQPMKPLSNITNGNQIDTTSSHTLWCFSKSVRIYSYEREDGNIICNGMQCIVKLEGYSLNTKPPLSEKSVIVKQKYKQRWCYLCKLHIGATQHKIGLYKNVLGLVVIWELFSKIGTRSHTYQ